jgi:DNA (cytosine-5)-methyltransferase 1
VGSLFSGIGGLDLGLERAGMEVAWQVEIDEFCQKVLAKHWPDVPRYGDVRDVGRHNLEAVDLICGGFPCQPWSVAGKRRGTKDDRHLWPEMVRVIGELKPTWVIGENVPGIIKPFLDQAIFDLESESYTCEAFVLSASAFDAPHNRGRLFIIAYANSKCRGYSSKRPSKIRLPSSTLPPHLWERTSESPILGMDDGVPDGVDRVKSLGNAVVPQVAEWIGRRIMEADSLDF